MQRDFIVDIFVLMMSGGEDLLVKGEFLVPDPRKKQQETTNEDGAKDSNTNAKKKNKGRNKSRPPPVKFDRSSRLCPVLVDVPEAAAPGDTPQCHFPKCGFMHDVAKYVEERRRPEGLQGRECHVFQQLGHCPRGVTCLFSHSHVVLGQDGVARNRVDKEKRRDKEECNHLDKELQNKLWKKAVDFSEVDRIVDDIYDERQRRLQKESSITKEDEAPPSKAPKVVVVEEEAPLSKASKVVEKEALPSKASKVMEDEAPPSKAPKVVEVVEASDTTTERELRRRRAIDWSDKLYLAPLTTVGNLPFRRVCKRLGADITCGEMAMALPLLQGHKPEWALVQRHRSEDLFGVQLCGGNPHQMARAAQLVEEHVDCDFVDINLGCPIDLVYKKGMGSGLMARRKPLEVMIKAMAQVLTRLVLSAPVLLLLLRGRFKLSKN